jgi:hypothetical protein
VLRTYTILRTAGGNLPASLHALPTWSSHWYPSRLLAPNPPEVSAPSVSAGALAGGGASGGGFSGGGGSSSSGGRPITLEVHLDINGKEFARATSSEFLPELVRKIRIATGLRI